MRGWNLPHLSSRHTAFLIMTEYRNDGAPFGAPFCLFPPLSQDHISSLEYILTLRHHEQERFRVLCGTATVTCAAVTIGD